MNAEDMLLHFSETLLILYIAYPNRIINKHAFRIQDLYAFLVMSFSSLQITLI